MLRNLIAVVNSPAVSLIGAQRSISITPRNCQNIKHYTPNSLEKRFLVWSGKYKSAEEVPLHVSHEVMERCRNKMRIRIANIMIVLTVVGCCIMVYSGKQAAKRGESVSKQNLDWHKKYNEQQAAAGANPETSK